MIVPRRTLLGGLAAVLMTRSAGGAPARAVDHRAVAGSWESELYGNVVEYDDKRWNVIDTLSGVSSSNEDLENCYLSLVEASAGLNVTFAPREFDDLDELAENAPDRHWGNGERRSSFHPRETVRSKQAVGFFYTEDDTMQTGARYMGYVEYREPLRKSDAWRWFELIVNITYIGSNGRPGFNYDALAESIDAVQLDGDDLFLAWSSDDVLAAIRAEIDAL
jgi:hypothetical protein